jgi:hypothetical protein
MNPSATLRAFWPGLLLLLCGSLPLRADQFGLFTYQVDHGRVTITDYPDNATGPVTIPAQIAGKPVSSIGGFAFRACTGLTSVTIPSSVTSIGDSAFSGCTGLTAINVEAGNLTYASDSGVLLNAARTALIFYPLGKTGPYSIPSSVASIGGEAFYGCTGLTGVTIPSSVTSIVSGTFRGCTGLTSLTIPSSVTSIEAEAFSGCSGLTSITIPSSVTSIDGNTFSGCSGLTSVTIPSSVTSIREEAFEDCTGLTSVTIPSSVINIGYGTFSNCTGLTSVTLEQGLATIGQGVFQGCTGLTSVTIPSSVTSIGYGAFYGCTGLTSVTIPSSLTGFGSLGRFAFYGCTGLTSLTIASGVTTIDISAFSGCTGLTSVTIPPSVDYIGDSAFSGCTGLTSFTIPSSVTYIGGSAFSNCTGLTSVTIPSRVTRIGRGYFDEEGVLHSIPAFPGCSSLASIVFVGNAPVTAQGEFSGAAPGFTIYYLSSRSGFSSPTWRGYPATMISETTHPAAAWLLEHGMGYDTDLHTDPDGDGVSLFLAWALDLDPTRPQCSQMPSPVLGGYSLILTFYAARPGLTYRVETSTDMTHWTTTDVSQYAPGPDGRGTAVVNLQAPRRFLRLTVES